MKYATAAALRAALDQRLVTEANTSGTEVARLRRRVTFERLLVRFALADGERWVLKGGAAVEVRMADWARTTKDIDLAARDTDPTDANVREALVDVLLFSAPDVGAAMSALRAFGCSPFIPQRNDALAPAS